MRFWTLGIIGATNYEVTTTVIIVGPILLALGVSYGLHITNRYAEEEGTRAQKMKGINAVYRSSCIFIRSDHCYRFHFSYIYADGANKKRLELLSEESWLSTY